MFERDPDDDDGREDLDPTDPDHYITEPHPEPLDDDTAAEVVSSEQPALAPTQESEIEGERKAAPAAPQKTKRKPGPKAGTKRTRKAMDEEHEPSASPAGPPPPPPPTDGGKPPADPPPGSNGGGDLFDPARLRLSQAFGQLSPTKKRYLTIRVRRPHKQEFIRVHPSPDYRIDTMVLEVRKDADTETYLVVPELWSELEGHLTAKTLYVAVTAQGALFMWTVRLPGPDGRLDPWSQTAHAAAHEGMKGWVSVRANRNEGCYEIFEPISKKPDPEWPAETLRELLALAFKGKTIEDIDHPVLRALRGED